MPTANDPLDPGRVLELLKRWQRTVAGFAARENEQVAARTSKRVTLRRQLDKLTERVETELKERLRGVKHGHDEEIRQAQEDHQARLQRIGEALRGSRRQLTERIQRERDSVIGQAQSGILRSKEERKRELERVREKHAEFEAALADDAKELGRLQASARKAARGFRPWAAGILAGKGLGEPAGADAGRPPRELQADLHRALDDAGGRLAAFGRLPLPKLFRFLPPEVLLPLLLVAALVGVVRTGQGPAGWATVGPWLGVAVGVFAVVYAAALMRARGPLRELGGSLHQARWLLDAAGRASASRVSRLKKQMLEEAEEQSEDLTETFRQSDQESQQRLHEGQRMVEEKHERVLATAERLRQRRLERLAERHRAAEEELRRMIGGELDARRADHDREVAAIDGECDRVIAQLAAEWERELLPIDRELRGLDALARARVPEWTPGFCESWTPPTEGMLAVPVGRIEVSAATLGGGLPEDPRLALPDPPDFTVPLALGFPRHGSLMLETEADPGEAVAAALNNAVLRLISTHPPGRVSFTIIDPVGLGKNFAGLMHLADYEDTIINSRIWTQSTQVEEKLAEINEHIEKVIQMYLRNEFETIIDYNEQAGIIAEKLHFLVIAGFPAGFSELAARRLNSIAASGARCGVYLLVHRDLRQPAPDPALEEELRSACLVARAADGGFRLAGVPAGGDRLRFEQPPAGELATEFIHRLGRAGIDSNRIEVPFSHVAPPPAERWTLDTTAELQVPIGRTGAKKLQLLAIGKGTRQHVLVAGKTGSGKSTLFHVMITNLALWCSPEQVEFYLVDFKKGVEFKCYGTKRLPHARVVAIESDREFGLSVLERVDAELKRRGELFRALGAQDLAGYKRAGGSEPMPRTLLLIDEFQEFFTEDDPVAQDASLLLDRIVRQGRAFGIHVILGSQTLGGAYTLARATLGQMVIRIALQCNEADAFLIMDEDNPAPRLLTRPGEGIYNDNAGALEANSPFQTVWLDDAERDRWLDQVAELAAERGGHGAPPIVFEGNAPADVRDNPELSSALARPPEHRPAPAHAWLGAPNSIKGPTRASFQRQSGSNLLVVGQGEERSRVMLGVALVSLAAQYPKGAARFVVLDPAPAESRGFFGRAAEAVAAAGHELRVAGPHELDDAMAGLAAELAARSEAGAADSRPDVYLLVRELERFRKLRQEDEFKFSLDDDDSAGPDPAKVFQDLVTEGPAAGIHTLLTIDTWNNVGRWIQRRALGEFEMRVLFQMSANDSANLVDSAAASMLGLHRALLHNDALGTSETFRPYAEPDGAWLDQVAARTAKPR